MDFASFKSLLRTKANRGTTLNSLLDQTVNAAIGFFESNYSLIYMKVTGSGTLASGASSFTLPARTKSFRWLRLHTTGDDGTISYTYLKRINPEDVGALGTSDPAGYWIDGDDTIRLDAAVDEDTDYSYQHIAFSTELSADADEHWFLDSPLPRQLLLNQCMAELAADMRDEKVMALYQQRVERQQVVLMNYQVDFEFEGRTDSMNYFTDYSLDPNNEG